jgi:hypothetical protein
MIFLPLLSISNVSPFSSSESGSIRNLFAWSGMTRFINASAATFFSDCAKHASDTTKNAQQKMSTLLSNIEKICELLSICKTDL